jgi:hypothetical protein
MAPINPTMHSGTNGQRKPHIHRILKSDTGNYFIGTLLDIQPFLAIAMEMEHHLKKSTRLLVQA